MLDKITKRTETMTIAIKAATKSQAGGRDFRLDERRLAGYGKPDTKE